MAFLIANNTAKGGNDDRDISKTDSQEEHKDKKIIKSIKEVAEITGLSAYAIRAGIKEGIFPAFQINGCGGKYFIDLDEFKATIRSLSNRSIQQNNDNTNVISINGIRRIKE